MSKVRHHPKPETLEAFATGKLDEARAVVIATHAAHCSKCARAINDLETIGGALLNEAPVSAMADDALASVLAKIDPAKVMPAPARMSTREGAAPEHVLPLSAYLDSDIDEVRWRPVAPGMAQSIIEAEGYRPGALRLLKIAPGMKMLEHSHTGGELTLILRGAYEDEVGAFGVGDLADLDEDHTHSPKAIGDEPCICLIATAAPLAFKSWAGRLAQPFIGL